MSDTRQISALRFHETGDPLDVVRHEIVETAAPGAGEVWVDVLFAPVNPADINILQGRYGKAPVLPAIPGSEGVGVVHPEGAPVELAGRRVLLPAGFGSWRSGGAVAVGKLVVVPGSIDPRQAAMLRVNPPTAWRMLHDFVRLGAGEWVVQNAANSGVGRCVIQICHHLGFKTINFVRRPEVVDELLALGADHVLVESREAFRSVRELAGDSPVRIGLNAVGGDSAVGVAGCLSPEGVHVTYGAMSLAAVKIPNAFLIFKNIRFCGFWLTRWDEQAKVDEREAMYRGLWEVAGEGEGLRVPVDGEFALDDFSAALARASEGMRSGKVLFNCAGID